MYIHVYLSRSIGLWAGTTDTKSEKKSSSDWVTSCEEYHVSHTKQTALTKLTERHRLGHTIFYYLPFFAKYFVFSLLAMPHRSHFFTHAAFNHTDKVQIHVYMYNITVMKIRVQILMHTHLVTSHHDKLSLAGWKAREEKCKKIVALRTLLHTCKIKVHSPYSLISDGGVREHGESDGLL